jgi:hypothetical protein
MSFSASTCITNTGTTQLGPTLYFYSDVTGFGTSFGSDLTENLIGENCPYIMENIPDGTTIVRIIDPLTNCGVDIVLQSSDLCNICNLNFDVYETQTVSQIVAGNLVGSCDDDISDYIINWYGPGEGSANLAFTSGYGTEFANIGWDNTHPLTGSQSPLVEAGIYTPVIDRVIVNGTAFSSTGAPGTYAANLNCFDSSVVNVEPLRCDNGNNVGDYSHHYLFENVSVGTPPDSLSASFLLSANTNYLAWRFRGFDVTDRFKMTFYGSFYDNTPIVIEDLVVGQNLSSTNFLISSVPKSANTSSFYAKVTCLTAFTISEGDYVTIEITPNPTNYNTKWDFYFKCLETFDCTSCLDNFKNSPYKIVTSSITSTLLSCNRSNISYEVSGCSENELLQSDTYKYFNVGNQGLTYYLNSFSQIEFNPTLWINNFACSSDYVMNSFNSNCNVLSSVCDTSSNNTITYQKSVVDDQGFIEIQFSSYSDLEHYYNSYQSFISNLGIYYDNTQINYYRYFNLKLPIPQNPSEQCGDTTLYNVYDIHCTSVVTTGDTSPTGPYFMTLTMPTIINNMNFSSCDLNCISNVNNLVNNVNYNSLTTSNNINVTTIVGSRYIIPFYCGKRLLVSVGSLTSDTRNGVLLVNKYANETIPYSVNDILIPSLTGQTCQFLGNSVTRYDNPSNVSHLQYVYIYKLQLFDENDVTNFRIYGTPITNFQYSGATIENGWTPIYELALEYSGGTITYQNPYYCI